MFSNLSTGSILYVLETKDNYKLSSGQVTNISNIRSKLSTYPNMNYMPSNEMLMDITATINGEKKEYKQVPTNLSVANFGDGGFVLADSKDALLEHINITIQNADAIINSVPTQQHIKEQCELIQKQLNPKLVAELERDNNIAKLQEQVNILTTQLSTVLSVLNGENKKQ